MMRVTGGSLRSRRVDAPRGRVVRPTPARVREALFSILGARIVGARVLDLFAGSGVVGFEALSRGAASVTFVEAHRPTALAIERAAASLEVGERVEVIPLPAERAARILTGRYDLVFADPPYTSAFPAELFARLRASGRIDEGSVVVYEHSGRLPAPHSAEFAARRTERYGDVALTFLHPAPKELDGDG